MVALIIFVCMVLAAAVFAMIYMRHSIDCGCFFWAVAAFTVLIVVPIAVIVTVSRIQLPSRVDVSPLAQLTPEQIARVEYIVLEGLDSINPTLTWESSPDDPRHPYPRRSYSFSYQGRSGRALITVVVHYSQENTEDSVRHGGQGAIFIENDNSTRAVLEPVRSSIHYLLPTSDVWFCSRVRIGNLTFSFSETRQLGNLRNDATSEFIALLAETLQE